MDQPLTEKLLAQSLGLLDLTRNDLDLMQHHELQPCSGNNKPQTGI